MRGRKPTPTKLKLLDANPGKRPLPEHEAAPPPAPSMRPPTHLDKEARAEWFRMVKQLTVLGLFTSIDKAALALYCVAWSRWSYAEEQLQKFGLVIAPNGYPTQSPWLAVSNKAMEHISKALAEFGMSPSSRSRVTALPLEPAGEGDKWAGIL